MNTVQRQIKINIPVEMMDFLLSKAQKYGLPVTTYLKHLIIKDAEKMEYPIFEPSERTEKRYLAALRQENKAVRVKGDVGRFLDAL